MQTSITIRKLDVFEKKGDPIEEYNRPGLKVTFNALHNNGKTSLELPVSVMKYRNRGWKASLDIDLDSEDCFPTQPTAGEAALKLASYLERIAIAIKENPDNFDLIKLNEMRV